jgi:hypothetical protein
MTTKNEADNGKMQGSSGGVGQNFQRAAAV